MSFEDLSEEILSKIAKHTAAAHYFDDEFYGRHPVNPHSVLIWCEDIRVAALASINSRMHRICLPVLFARVHIRLEKYDTRELGALRKFYKLVQRRTHIAFHITSLDLSGWRPSLTSEDHNSDLLATIIPLLPRLSRVEANTPICVTVRLLEAIQKHKHLLSISGDIRSANLDEFTRLADSVDFSKIRHRYSDYTCSPEMLVKWLAIGINVESAVIIFNPADSEIFSSLRWTQLRSIKLFVDAGEEGHASELWNWLPTFVLKISPNVSEITFCHADPDNPVFLDEFLPLLAGLAPASAGGRESHRKLAYIISFSIKRRSQQAPSPQRQSDAHSSIEEYDWRRDWLTSSITLLCEESLAYRNSSAFFPWLSCFGCMADEIQIDTSTFIRVKTGILEQLLVGIEAFKNLRKLSFPNLDKDMFPRSTSRDLETEAEILSMIGEFSVSLKGKCPRLDTVSYFTYGFKVSSFTRELRVRFRDQLLQDGGGIAYDIQPLRAYH